MTKHRRKREPNAADGADAGNADDGDDTTDVREALERVLAHAEAQGEVYVGAVSDHALIRAALTDAELPGDRRIDPATTNADQPDGAS